MSQVRKPGGPAKRKPGAPGPERKSAPKGPVVTPQVLGIVFFLIIVIGAIVYWQMVIVKFKNELNTLQGSINSAQSTIATYEKKGEMLPAAKQVNTAIREKLNMLDYLFLVDQDSVVPFWEDTFFPLLLSSNIYPVQGTSQILADKYVFKINMAMDPFNTLPASVFFDGENEIFQIDYEGEKDGVPVDKVLNTQPPDFLHSYNITLTKWYGTYEDVQKFIKLLQTKRNAVLITVHCFKNNDKDNVGLYRIVTSWDMQLSVYFMNPEAQASGDNPPDPPGAKTC